MWMPELRLKLVKYHINIALGDFCAKLGIKYIFKLKIGYESLYKTSKYNAFGGIKSNCQEFSVPLS
jgi:hypothetical protein